LAVLVLPNTGVGEITFERAYGSNFPDAAGAVRQTADGGYIVAGYGYFISPMQVVYVYVVKTDSIGDTLWTRTYGDSCQQGGHSIQQTSDGGYVVAGYQRVRRSGGWSPDWYIIKTDPAGDTVWTRTYGFESIDRAYSIQQTQDGGYIVTGMITPAGREDRDIWLVKLDSVGDTLWTRTFGSDTVSEVGRSVHQTSDGGFVIAGYVNYIGFMSDVCLLKTDSFGNQMWMKTYWDEGALNQGNSVQPTSDGGYIIAATSNGGAYIIKTDFQGDTLWSGVHGGGGGGASACQTYDGGYIMAGSALYDSTANDVYVIKFNSAGDTVWSKHFGGRSGDSGACIRQTADSGYVVAGMTEEYGTRSWDFYLIKMSKDGQLIPMKDGMVVSLELPPDTVFVDSTYYVKAVVKNAGNMLDTFYVLATIDGYVDSALVEDLDPGSSYQRWFANWHVPTDDSIVYTMRVCTHAFNDIDTTNDCMQKTIFAYNPTGVEEGLNRTSVSGFRLWQNSPNPFHRSTGIQYSLPVECDFTLSVYDVTGSLVDELVDKRQGAGVFRVQWIAESHADGIYFCRLMAGNLTETKKMVLVR